MEAWVRIPLLTPCWLLVHSSSVKHRMPPWQCTRTETQHRIARTKMQAQNQSCATSTNISTSVNLSTMRNKYKHLNMVNKVETPLNVPWYIKHNTMVRLTWYRGTLNMVPWYIKHGRCYINSILTNFLYTFDNKIQKALFITTSTSCLMMNTINVQKSYD